MKLLKKGKNKPQKAMVWVKTRKIASVVECINPLLAKKYSSRSGAREEGTGENQKRTARKKES